MNRVGDEKSRIIKGRANSLVPIAAFSLTSPEYSLLASGVVGGHFQKLHGPASVLRPSHLVQPLLTSFIGYSFTGSYHRQKSLDHNELEIYPISELPYACRKTIGDNPFQNSQ